MTFESWVTRNAWYRYARSVPHEVPYLLVDRSPCCDPFFDPFADSATERAPTISGLCRRWKRFQPGLRVVYITRLNRRVAEAMNRPIATTGAVYLMVAALEIVDIIESHAIAARAFKNRRFVARPSVTPYPPNLAHSKATRAAVARNACIVHDDKKRAHTPLTSTNVMWKNAYARYEERQRKYGLRVALCKIIKSDGRDALCLDAAKAPILRQSDWENAGITSNMNVNGLHIPYGYAAKLAKQIAESAAK